MDKIILLEKLINIASNRTYKIKLTVDGRTKKYLFYGLIGDNIGSYQFTMYEDGEIENINKNTFFTLNDLNGIYQAAKEMRKINYK